VTYRCNYSKIMKENYPPFNLNSKISYYTTTQNYWQIVENNYIINQSIINDNQKKIGATKNELYSKLIKELVIVTERKLLIYNRCEE